VYDRHKTEFPLLVKIIDATDYLSIQVHPDDQLAGKRKLGNGKTEMWYILDAAPDAELISGFNREMNVNTYLQYLRNKKLKEILNVEMVKKDDLFFIPSGRVHALGPGILLAEIQQTSDTTYRIYDWDRFDANGNPRELHTDLALEAIDFKMYDSYRTHYRPMLNHASPLVDCPYFTTNLLTFDRTMEKDYSGLDSFVVYLGLEGKVGLRSGDNRLLISPGEVVLLPATIENVVLEPSTTGKLLEVYIS
jgi:mannose-6-phosphate isomerase